MPGFVGFHRRAEYDGSIALFTIPRVPEAIRDAGVFLDHHPMQGSAIDGEIHAGVKQARD